MQDLAPHTPAPVRTWIDYRLLVPLLLHAVACQAILSMLRVTTSYRAVELGLSEAWLGIISATYAVLPIFLAVWIGRFVDRGHDALATWIGAWMVVGCCLGFRLSDATALDLMLYSALLGVGQLFLMVAHQVLCVRASSDDRRETVFGNYMVANALGQGIGPLVVGWLGGAARIPPTRFLFGVAVVAALISLVITIWITPSRQAKTKGARAEITPVPELLRTPGLPTLLIASIIIVTSQDLVVIYLPLLGTERGIDVGHIGMLLMLRAAVSMVSRVFYAPMIRAVGRVPLTVFTMLAAACAYVVIAAPVPLAAMYVAVVVIGFGLGIAATLSISNVVDIVPPSARAIAVSLRITGNRIGQVAMPFTAGVIAAAAGAGGIFAVVALSLAAAGTAVHVVRSGKA